MLDFILPYVGIILVILLGPPICGLLVNGVSKLYNHFVLKQKSKRFKTKVKEMESEIAKEREMSNIEVEIIGEVVK